MQSVAALAKDHFLHRLLTYFILETMRPLKRQTARYMSAGIAAA